MTARIYNSCCSTRGMMYPTPESLQAKVNEYFESCTCRVGKHESLTPTMSGLARYLGFSSRTQLLSYQNNENPLYEDVINDARLRVEEYLEQQLVHTRSPAGVIFALKNNAGWVDRIERVEHKQAEEEKKMVNAIAWVDDPIPIDAVKPTPLEVGEGKKKGTVDDGNNDE